MNELELLKLIRDSNKAGMTHYSPFTEGGVGVLADEYLSQFPSTEDAWKEAMYHRALAEKGLGEPHYGGQLMADTEHYLYDRAKSNPWILPLVYDWAKRFGFMTDDNTSGATRRQLRAGYGLTD